MKKILKWLLCIKDEPKASPDGEASKEAKSHCEVMFFNPNMDVEETYGRTIPPNFNAPCLSFAARVLKHIIDKGLAPSDVYARGEISRQNYSRIISADDSRVNKMTAMQFCIGLRLTLEESILLLETGGYAFSNVLKEDKAFKYCIEHGLYNMDEVRRRM